MKETIKIGKHIFEAYVPSYVNANFMKKQRKTMTLQAIGDFHGISRERVRQILRDYCGMKSSIVPKVTRKWKFKKDWRQDPLSVLVI